MSEKHPCVEELQQAGVDPRLVKVAEEYFRGDTLAQVFLDGLIILGLLALITSGALLIFR